uniref:Uncharacterized protein LOC104266093 n=1 Tax=Phallusia mammillata TaxID=59560 RepID=A0A6F9DJV5_9ASCI|nr:uncharacterized protein LOC104266093 [Phallusia mammillata]
MRHFEIYYVDSHVTKSDVEKAVDKELLGPGCLLGYRAMHRKVRCTYNLKVPRHLVYKVMQDLDPNGLAHRNVQHKKKRDKHPFVSDGPLWVVSLDGHDKLCGYQNYTFPLGIYGCMDTFSRKIMFLFVTQSNSSPLVIGKKYLEFLCETLLLPVHLRLDRGTETGKMASIHSYLIQHIGYYTDATDSILYGPSNTNKIERWWRDLHERLEKFFKVQLQSLLVEKKYNRESPVDRFYFTYMVQL